VPNEPLPAGVELQQGMLVEPPALEKGQQQISILINADTGVAGNLRPGDMVDVLATFQPDDQTRSPASARTIIRRARIVTIGLPRAAARPGADDNPLRQGNSSNAQQVLVPVTFALRPTLSLRLTYAETFASEIRLSLIRRGDETRKLAANKREYTLPPTRARTPEPKQ
jgi:pilus assembly protein CpaB